jgi:hypothetical protein
LSLRARPARCGRLASVRHWYRLSAGRSSRALVVGRGRRLGMPTVLCAAGLRRSAVD